MIFRLLSYNIRHGGAGREEPLARVIRACNPDLVVFQEATREEVIARLAAETGMAQCGTRRRQSLGFMARRPVTHYEWYRPRLSRHAFLEIVPESGWDLRVFGVHLSAVHSAWTERRRMIELRALLRSIQRHQHGCHVLVGDFNTLAPGELLDFRKLPQRLRALVWLSGGRVRWRTIQMVLDARYVDAFRLLHPNDPGFSFPTWDPNVRLDYLFIPQAFRDRVPACTIVSNADTRAASDHLPLLGELAVERAETPPINRPPATS